jgi:hypothetical protein
MLLVVGVFAVAAVILLAMMANRYGRMLEDRDGGVEAFIEVRVELKRAIEKGASGEELKEVRDNALALAGLEKREYFELLRRYRAWKRGREEAAVFEEERKRLEAVDLGPYERPDL